MRQPLTETDALMMAQKSETMRRLNPHLAQPAPRVATLAGSEGHCAPSGVKTPTTGRKGKKRREMNKIEAEFSFLLQARVNRGEIVSFDYEGITLRWADGMRYTPDFTVVQKVEMSSDDHAGLAAAIRLLLIEVKGAYCWKQDLVKYRAAKANWPLFRFEFWEKIDGVWQITR